MLGLPKGLGEHVLNAGAPITIGTLVLGGSANMYKLRSTRTNYKLRVLIKTGGNKVNNPEAELLRSMLTMLVMSKMLLQVPFF
jgi:hypothetical protein